MVTMEIKFGKFIKMYNFIYIKKFEYILPIATLKGAQ